MQCKQSIRIQIRIISHPIHHHHPASRRNRNREIKKKKSREKSSPLENSFRQEKGASLTRSLTRVARKWEKKRGTVTTNCWRKTIVHRLLSNYPFREKEREKKVYFYPGSFADYCIVRARPLNRATEKWRGERCERRSEKEREGKNGEKRWRRYKVRGAEALVVLPYYYSRPS